MFTKIGIENFEGISNRVELDFFTKSRNREENRYLYKTHDGKYINKMIGILAENASGKTTIIDGVGIIGSLMAEPVMTSDFDVEVAKIRNLIRHQPDVDSKVVNQMLDKLYNSVRIDFQNASNPEKDTELETEMYIESAEKKYEGYYTYKIKLNGKKRKIVDEQLSFRRNYDDLDEKIINVKDTSEGQVYYINKYYNNIMELDGTNKEDLKYIYDYVKNFYKHYNINSEIFGTNTSDFSSERDYIVFYKAHPEIMKNIIQIVDSKIKNARIKTDGEDEELVYELKAGGNITQTELSKGTKRFMNLVISAVNTIKNNGNMMIDEIEANMHKELIYLILRLFAEWKENCTQLIFTTNLPEVFECEDETGKKIFKQDSIYFLNNEDGNVKAIRMSDIKPDGKKRIKGDASVSSVYERSGLIMQPDKEKINDFILNIENDFHKA